ncbi:heavy metal translocating P-type ATPase [Ruminiclostridium cellulolyticum]|uniref:Cd(2+)-exporting ATPase n=1 Tax=Ruminiclostridium cellulolyticum (strain ATCC 35319 / DSM 5812 / JCM 6584 / H10) TaxID=394503 RepID=B8I541_RUMCH|nr:heavy metal translocating P-type ATPase [Ruminiclostridium cellulolyticum]ACL74621.1 cadmium-translocating P-type ATPase [Ruminiclostridium cellulolyticum H10]
MNKAKKVIIRIGAGTLLLIIAVVASFPSYLNLAFFVSAYLIIGGDVLWRALRNISHGQVFDENFLMSIATVGAFFVGEYPEAVSVMLFYQVGEMFQDFAVNRSRKSISALMDIRPDYANVKRNGELVTVDPEEVVINEVIVVKAGEKIPLDGKVLEGYSLVDTSALTGESVPREINTGSEVLSGCINLIGLLTIQVTKEFGESTVSKILDLVENASSKKAKRENFITRFARYYTPIVVIVAVTLAVVPPLLVPGATFSDWIYRALIFLVVSCPCALVISIPLGFFGGIGGASRLGILIKGGNYLEALAAAEVVVFDKTGTLTKGTFKVTEIHPVGISDSDLFELTAHAESYSNHPISQSLKNAFKSEIDNSRIKGVEEIPGYGVKAVVDEKTIYAGNSKLMDKIGAVYSQNKTVGTVVHVTISGIYSGYIVISDEIKEDSASAITRLKAFGINKTVLLTGDAKDVGESVGETLGLDEVYTELLPADKVNKVEKLIAEKSPKGNLIFAGDGINDAPVLSRADVGIAMGGLGSDAAIEAADVVIMNDEPSKIATAIAISKKTLRIVNQNIVLALGVKAIVLAMGAFGLSNLWEAVFADVGVSVIAILNSARALRVDKAFK